MSKNTEELVASGVSRRTLVKGAAWSVPVVAVAAATPLATASPTNSGACKTGEAGKLYSYKPKNYGNNDSMGPQYNVAEIEVLTGGYVKVKYVKDYPNQTSINVNGQIIHRSPDSGVKAGHECSIPLSGIGGGICDPTFIQVDGNNTHYYGGGQFR